MIAISKAAAGSIAAPAINLDHLSWSSLYTFKSCPKKYAYRYLEKAQAERVSAPLPFGAAIHKAAESLHQAQLEGRPLPSIERLSETFNTEWAERVKEVSEVTFGKKDTAASLRMLAKRMLEAYRDNLSQKQRHPTIIGIEQRYKFQFLPDVPPILMIADLIELDGDTLIISDLKTSASRWSYSKTLESLPQVVLYSHGLMPLLKATGARRLVTRFIVITKAKKSVVQVMEPKPTQADVVRLQEQVAGIYKAIQGGAYYRIENWACKSCPYRRRCLGR